MNTMMTNREMGFALLRAPFQAMKNMFASMAQTISRAEQLDALNNMSDDDLAARGISRADAAQTILRN